MNVAIYARVSSEKQEKQETVQSQIACLRDFAVKKGYVIVNEYVDEGYSGEMLARPALDKLRDDASAKLFDSVLVYSPDRLSRKYVYQGLIRIELKKYDIEIIFINNPESNDKPETELLVGVQGLIGEYERAQIIERTRRGKLFKARKGILITSIGPYGYRYVKKDVTLDKNGYYEIEENEAVIVGLIFNLFVNNRMSKRALARELTRRGIRPRRGIHWRTSSIDKILRNECYKGIAHYNKHIGVEPEKRNPNSAVYRRRKNSSMRLRPKEEWIPIKLADNLRIIDADVFNHAQEILEKNSSILPRESKHEYLLKGLLECGQCHSPYVGSPCHGKLYYRCGNRYRKFPLPKECNAGTVKADKIEVVVWQTISEAIQNPDLVIEQIKKHSDTVNENAEKLEQEIKVLEQKLIGVKRGRDRFLDAYGEGTITKQELKELMDKSREEESFLARERARLVEQFSKVMSTSEIKRNIYDYCTAIKPHLETLSFQEKRQILQLLVRKVILEHDGTVRIKATIPIREEERIVNTSSGCCVRR